MGDTYTVTSSPRGAGPEGRPLDLAESCSYLHLQPCISSAQLFLAVTGSQSPAGGPEGSSCVFPLFSASFQTLQSNTGSQKVLFFISLATSQRSPRP